MALFLFILINTFLASAGADNSTYLHLLQNLDANETFVKEFDEYVKLLDKGQTAITFPCKPYPRPATKTTSVHQLGPADVRVIAGLGDSITAGNGIKAKTVLGLLLENRGLSWSIGGDDSIDEVYTLPNILRVYNPNITGFSVGTGNVWQESVSHLNVAHPGDETKDMPGQAEKLIQRMIQDESIRFAEDWKVITIFVGGNDLCDFCTDKEKFSADSYITHLQRTLDILHEQVPRAFVNLVPVLNVSIVKELNANFVCKALHLYLCSCVAFPASAESEAETQQEIDKYQNYARRLVESGRYDTRDDFTVVLQPFFINSKPPRLPDGKADVSYFAPDCFHLHRKGHQEAAKALWNNMIEPVGEKKTRWLPGEPADCPSATQPYFYTRKNSGLLSSGVREDLINDPPGHVSSQAQADSRDDHSPGVTVVAVVCVLGFLLAIVFAAVKWKRNIKIMNANHYSNL